VTTSTVGLPHPFDDGAAYHRAMGRWSRAVGSVFLDWIAPPAGMRWLDVGCGTGVFTELLLDICSPAAVIGIDPAQAQIDYARRQSIAQQVNFPVADAQALPFADSTFDAVSSALVLNFIPDRRRALSEMRRVTRPAGLVCGYVWDFAAELSPSWPLRLSMRQLGMDAQPVPGGQDTGLDALTGLFKSVGFEEIAARSIKITVPFSDFDEFWGAQTARYSPVAKTIAAMTERDRMRLMATVWASVPVRPDGGIEYWARANAIRARVPG
jgi:ubiquinone/menaquinone biosynthesis C-methylase UbiE